MGMSTSVVAFRDMGGEFTRMVEVKLFCEAHHVSYPKEVQDYFGSNVIESVETLRDELLTVDLGGALTEWQDESAQGYEVDVTKLPSEVKTLRFYNSW